MRGLNISKIIGMPPNIRHFMAYDVVIQIFEQVELVNLDLLDFF